MDCFNSTDPVAVNSTLLYAHNNDVDNLWFRSDMAGPLESCSPPRPWQSQCTVCRHDGTVHAMCKKLADGVRVIMEAGEKPVNIFKSGCPTPPTPPAPAEDAQQWLQPVIGTIVTLLLLLIIIGVFLYCKYCKNRKEQTQNEIQNNPQEVMEMMEMTAEANEENHTPPLLMKPSCCVDSINNGSQQQLGVQQV